MCISDTTCTAGRFLLDYLSSPLILLCSYFMALFSLVSPSDKAPVIVINSQETGCGDHLTDRPDFGKQSFSCTAPTCWNSLPPSVINCDTMYSTRLKTSLFNTTYS